MRFRAVLPYALVVVVSVALDQWIKQLAEARLPFQEAVDLLPFLALYRTYNTGVAFSMFSSVGDVGLIAISAGVMVFVLYLAGRTGPGDWIARLGFALIVGGALGNVVDRIAYGHVIDYFLFHTPVWSFAVFNLADALITVGAVLVILQELLLWRASRSGANPADD